MGKTEEENTGNYKPRRNTNELISRFSGARIFFLHVCARTRTRVVRLGAQCTDHWTTEQSHGVGVPAVQLSTHVKSSTLYGFTVIRSYIQIFSAWWETTILYNYVATLCELRYDWTN